MNMLNIINNHSIESERFLAEAEEKIIVRFMEIAGLKDEYQDATHPDEPVEYIEYAQSVLVIEFANRGYEIGEYSESSPVRDGVDGQLRTRIYLLHNGNTVAYRDIKIKIYTSRMTGYGTTL